MVGRRAYRRIGVNDIDRNQLVEAAIANGKPDWGGGCLDPNVPQGYVFANGKLTWEERAGQYHHNFGVFMRSWLAPCVTEPQLLRVKGPEPLRLLLVNLCHLGKWSFPGLNQLL